MNRARAREHTAAWRIALATLLAACGLSASSVSAQSPDLREIRPDVILLVDTSGSMDYALGSASGVGGQLPICSGNAGSPSQRSRWITLVESLTGTYSSGYYCTTVDRRTAYVGAPDQFSPHPYARPSGTQGTDGVLDQYLDRVRFGLMTYDNLYGLLGLTPASTQYMVTSTVWAANTVAVLGPRGDYSYGNAYPLRFPGCTTTYTVNGGARRALVGSESFGGALVSVGPDSTDVHVTNAQIQTALLNARPYGSTPTGAMLDDLRYYLANDPDVAPILAAGGSGDPYRACRRRYAILITDGESSDPFRTSLHCDVGAGSSCPYERPVDISADLCRFDGTQCTGALNGLFVVAYATGAGATGTTCTVDANCSTGQACVSGRCSTVTPELNDIALRGGTTQAILAIDRATLMGGLSRALDQAQPGTTTRTAPGFALSQSAYAAGTLGATSGPQEQLQMSSGFLTSNATTGAPWSGVLDRTHFVCDATLTPVQQPLNPNDHFADTLNARNLTSTPRALYTVAVTDPTKSNGYITGNPASGLSFTPLVSHPSNYVSGYSLSTFDEGNAGITPQHFGLAAGDVATRTAIFDYVHGRAPSTRAAARLGDIYHSTPQVVTAPRVDIDDGAYQLFRQRPEIGSRPTMVYVGSNDGILHAFTLEDDPTGMARWTGGQELWGFVPPTLMPNALNSGRTSHQFMVDGTPVVRDVVFRRAPGDASAPDTYHTVLVVGLRAGGNAYVALDVSDPLHPVFLWQFTHAQMGLTYGRPAIGQAMVEIGGVLQERAIAVLPGGAGEINVPAANAAMAAGCAIPAASRPTPVPDGVTSSRAARRCWMPNTGRSLHVVDVATGEVLQSFLAAGSGASPPIPSPLTGGVALYSGETGQFATRGFMVDADGVLWRLDMSLPNPSDWTFTPMHDLYWADGATSGQPVYDPPIVSVDNALNPVVVVGGGDQDNLESRLPTRVASVTELVDHTISPSPSRASVNWEVRLQPGEQVTGPMVLYANYVYFGTFWSNPDPTDACQYGSSRIWGLHYLNGGATAPVPYTSGTGVFPQPGLVGISGAVDTFFTDTAGIVFGVGIAQRPNCTTGAGITDQYLGQRYQISNLRPGSFQLVAQVSGTGSSSSPSTASSVQTVTLATLPPPPAQSRALSYQPAADF